MESYWPSLLLALNAFKTFRIDQKNPIALRDNDFLGATRFHADWEPIFSGIRRAGIPGKTRENMPLLAGKGNQAY